MFTEMVQHMFLCRINKNYPLLSLNTPSYLELWAMYAFIGNEKKLLSQNYHYNHTFSEVLQEPLEPLLM